MSGVSLPVSRPTGRALIIGNAPSRVQPLATLQRLGFTCAEVDDPYAAMLELCRRPLVYGSIVLALGSVYREELQLVSSIKRRYPHLEIWLTQIEGRQAALAESMRLGADGLLADDGLHRTGSGSVAPVEAAAYRADPDALPVAPTVRKIEPEPVEDSVDTLGSEPVLTADELRALLQEQPILPPGDER